MANGPCRPDTARRRAVPARWGSCLDGPSCLPCRASMGFVPGLRPMARPMGRLTVPCRPLGMTIFPVPCRPTARQPKNISFSPNFHRVFEQDSIIFITIFTKAHRFTFTTVPHNHKSQHKRKDKETRLYENDDQKELFGALALALWR